MEIYSPHFPSSFKREEKKNNPAHCWDWHECTIIYVLKFDFIFLSRIKICRLIVDLKWNEKMTQMERQKKKKKKKEKSTALRYLSTIYLFILGV